MRLSSLLVAMTVIAIAPRPGATQSAADGPPLGARALSGAAGVKIFLPAGSVRVIGWNRDSVVARGRVPRSERFVFGGEKDSSARALVVGILDFSGADVSRACDIVVYVPRHATVSVKTATADIDATDISGWFYTVSGSIHLRGSSTSTDVQSINGNLDVDVAAPWVRARTGEGHLLLRGAPQDADASTISGTLDVASASLMRGQFASVSGDIHYVGSPPAGSIFDFSNHSGAVDLLLATDASGVFALSSVTGPIENGMSGARPVAATPHSLRLVLGRGAPAGSAQVTVRTFKGPIRLRPQT